MQKFVHLRLHTDLSLNKSIITVEQAAKKANELGLGALAITDTHNIFGAIKFYEETQDSGIKGIIGSELLIENEDNSIYPVVALVKNRAGYLNLLKLINKSYYQNEKSNFAAIKKEWLNEESVKDLIILSGAREGFVGKLLLDNNPSEAEKEASFWKKITNNNYYLELQREGNKQENEYIEKATSLASQTQIPVVATHPILFLNKSDFLAHEAKTCINTKEMVLDPNREKKYNPEFYFKSPEEMVELFKDIPQAIQNTLNIAQKCNFNLELLNPLIPDYIAPNNENLESYFERISWEGLEKRLKEDFSEEEINEKKSFYQKRLTSEIEMIKQMGFPSYFLIVSDYIKWAKEQNIPVGPGRGSGAGSLVAYSLYITEIDPIKYDLLFERFLNPERVSMPDFDIDFCQERRDEVIQYVRQKYGENRVCHIGTFGTMKPKVIIRDVGRVLGYPHNFVDGLARMIIQKPGEEITLKSYIETDEKFKAYIEKDEEAKKIINIGLKIEGITRQIGTHAAGVLISKGDIDNYTAVYRPENSGVVVSQFDGEDVAKAGLIKFDFLGLKNLTIIAQAIDLINQRPEFTDKKFNINKINMSDKATLDIFAKGNTISIFQSEGAGAKALAQRLKPDCFEDIIAFVALNRPGPLQSGMVDDYINRKHGLDNVDYMHESIKEILLPTYGVIVYQEQVMQIAQKMAGYTLGGADLLRRAMGKKKPEEMAKQKNIFIEGSVKNGVDPQKAEEIFHLIEMFADYGFNKSHSAAYGLIAYQTAYLKAHYPTEFMTASLNYSLSDEDKLALLVKDCRENNIEVLPVDVNKSNELFSIEENGKIRYGLSAVKGIGEGVSKAIERIRNEKGNFTDIFDFVEKVGKEGTNKRVLDPLVKSGAFDLIEKNRNKVFSNIPNILKYMKAYHDKQSETQGLVATALAEMGKKTKKKKVELSRPKLEEIDDWSEIERLKNEKDALGFYFSENPYIYYAKKLGGLEFLTPIEKIEDVYEDGKNTTVIAGIITDIQVFKSKKGAFVDVIDNSSQKTITVFKDLMDVSKDILQKDQFAAFEIRMSPDNRGNGEMRITVDNAYSFGQLQEMLVEKVFVAATQENSEEKWLKVCQQYPGTTPIILCNKNEATEKYNKVASMKHISFNPKAIEELKNIFGEKWVVLQYGKNLKLQPTKKKILNKKP